MRVNVWESSLKEYWGEIALPDNGIEGYGTYNILSYTGTLMYTELKREEMESNKNKNLVHDKCNISSQLVNIL